MKRPCNDFGSEAWTMTASNSDKLDACDQPCLRKICGVHWSLHVTSAEIRRRTGQLPVSKLIAKRRLKLFGHIARSDPASDTRRAVAATAPRDRRRPRGRPRNRWRSTIEADVASLNFGLHTAWRRAQDRTFWRAKALRASHCSRRLEGRKEISSNLDYQIA